MDTIQIILLIMILLGTQYMVTMEGFSSDVGFAFWGVQPWNGWPY